MRFTDILRKLAVTGIHRTMLITLFAVFVFLSGLYATKWEAFTNTNNLTDIVLAEDRIFTSTWGGVAVYDYSAEASADEKIRLNKVWTSVDGLASNDVRTLAYEENTGDLWAGTFNDGITIIKTSGATLSVNNASHNINNKIRRIIVRDRLIYVATSQGISQFFYLEGLAIPLIGNQYITNEDVLDMALSENSYLYCATTTGVSFVHTDSLDIETAWHKWTASNSPLTQGPAISLSVNADYVAMNTLTTLHRHSANPFASDWRSWSTGAGGLRDSVFTVSLTPANGILVSYGIWDEDTMTLLRKTDSPWGYIDPAGTLNEPGTLPPGFQSGWEFPTESIHRMASGDAGTVFATWGEGFFLYAERDYHIVNNCIGFQTISEITTDRNHRMWFASGWLGGSMTKRGTRGVSEWFDGVWTTYTTKNSPLMIDNIRNVAVDNNNRKWFGSWDGSIFGWRPGAFSYDDATGDWKWYTGTGMRQWTEGSGWSGVIPGTPGVLNTTIGEIAVDKDGNILLSSSGDGITVLTPDYELLGTFQIPASYGIYQSVSFIHDSGSRYFFGLNVDNKLVIWNNESLPINITGAWDQAEPSELRTSAIYGVVTIENVFGETEHWIACSQGLFMWDGDDWFIYETVIKRKKYVNGSWVNDTLYYVDEERLFAAEREARPTAIFLDPFNRIWVGSLEHGITMYDPETERFTNYYQNNSPLLSNYITCFGYDPIGGKLLIGTPEGLNTLEIGIQIKTETKLRSVKAFPNPFFPDMDGTVSLVNMPSESMPAGNNVCRIYDTSGQLVIELKENVFARFEWNGNNKNNRKCSSGIYFYIVTDSKGVTGRGKLALIRGFR
jgi:hypothetical protein